MRLSRRRLQAALTLSARLCLVLGLAALFTLVGIVSSKARSLTLRGTEAERFGRIMLEFDEATKVSVRNANGVLILSFPRQVMIAERLATEMPGYIAMVRRDPDGTGVRLALTRPFRSNLLEAGEKVFVDLLPENWVGLPPGLPPEVVDELARRARAAEARVRSELTQRRAAEPSILTVQVAELPTLTRLVFVPPAVVPTSFKADGHEVELRFDAPLRLDLSQVRGRLAASVRAFDVDAQADALIVRLSLQKDHEARGFREDASFVVDIAKPRAITEQPGAAPTAPDMASARPAKPVPEANAAAGAPAQPLAAVPSVSRAPAREPPRPPSAAPLRPGVVVDAGGLTITFPFSSRTAAAGYERGGLATVAFHTAEPIEFGPLPPGAEAFVRRHDVAREGAFSVVRLMLAEPKLVRMAPQGDGWAVTIGDKVLVPSEPLAVKRAVDDSGRTVLDIPLADASGVHWIEEIEGGERIAVVTAFGAPRGIPKPQRFVEFRLLPTAHGLAVAADADDLIVRSGVEGATISRGSGLSISLPGSSKDLLAAGASAGNPVVAREPWLEAQKGSILARLRRLMHEAAEAPRSQRSRARFELASFLAANGFNPEALSVLAFAADEDPALLRERRFVLLQGITTARMHRNADAHRILSADFLGDDPEAILWRAVVDARMRRWPQALAGFRRSAVMLEGYPDDLQGPIRLAAARAALAMKDFGYAERELTAAGQLIPGSVPAGAVAFLRARLDEAVSRPEAALDALRRLAENAERPVAAEAALHWIELSLRERVMGAEEATARLETLSVIWRGDEIEIAALGHLGRLYAQAGRWREAFLIARKANRIFPDHEVTRALHDDTGRLFEDLFLTGRGETLSRIDALALYFDFMEFTPIGRRGDEIVRRLADRLVELDLLEQAAGLLEHQVTMRLSGAARATVAARLATIRLMDGKPAQAVEALHATRLPELPASIRRARVLLEARALSDLSRTDLALEVLADEAGAEIDRLRADILWNGRRWREAGEAHEHLVGTRWQGREVLTDQDRSDLMRAAIAYSLGDEAIALDRLRAKFSAKMADSSDAGVFAFVTRPNVSATRAFRDLARSVTNADTLADFLAEYRKLYPDAAAAERPRRRSPSGAAVPAEPLPGADAAAAPAQMPPEGQAARPQASGPDAASQPPRG